MDGISSLLRSKGLRVTRIRRKLLEYLYKKKTPDHFESISQAFEKESDPATIYRNLQCFQRLGIVEAHSFGDKKTWYSLVDYNKSHKHFVICKTCKKVFELGACRWDFLNKYIEEKYKFKNVTHQLEFFGICANCQLTRNLSRA